MDMDIDKEIYKSEDIAAEVLGNIFNQEFYYRGIPSGYESLDDKVNGFRKGEVIVLASRPSIGKTTLALNILANISLRQVNGDNEVNHTPVGIISLELTKQELIRRIIFSEYNGKESNLFLAHKVTAEEYSNLGVAATKIKDANIHLYCPPKLGIQHLCEIARQMKESNNIEILFIDYVQLVRGEGATRNEEMTMVSAEIKSLARELDLPIILLSELSRQASEDNRPKLTHLRDSGTLEQDADVVVILHRTQPEWVKNTSKSGKDDVENEGYETDLIVCKNRNGETGTVKFLFNTALKKFIDVDPNNSPYSF